MSLHVKVTPLDIGTAAQAGPAEMLACPADVQPDTIRSFLVQRFGEPTEVAWTRTERHEHLSVGWIFPLEPAAEMGEALELLCVPFVGVSDGSLRPLFEVLADERQDLERLAAAGLLDSLTVVETPDREYSPDSHDASRG